VDATDTVVFRNADPPRSKSAIPGDRPVGYEDSVGPSPRKGKMGMGRTANLLKRAGKETGTEVSALGAWGLDVTAGYGMDEAEARPKPKTIHYQTLNPNPKPLITSP
jgi:hypothetical protein